MTAPRWGQGDNDPARYDVTEDDAMVAAEFFARAVKTWNPIEALAMTLATDRATIRARHQARTAELFQPMTAPSAKAKP